MKNILLIALLSLLFIACQKIEGEGGTGTITGNVTTNNYNNAGELTGIYPAADEDVFIIYGSNGISYDDKVSTSYDGSFKFTYLTPGDYSVFIYSDCDTCASGQQYVIKTATISAKGEVVNVGELINND